MTSIEPKDNAWVEEAHLSAKWGHAEEAAHQLEVEQVFRGDFFKPKETEPEGTQQMELVRSSLGATLVRKLVQMIGTNARVTRAVDQDGTEASARRADKLERMLRGWDNSVTRFERAPAYHMGEYMGILRGRAGLRALYKPGVAYPQIRREVLDPLSYFPVYGNDGIDWYTIERWMTRWELQQYFDGISDEDKMRKNIQPPDWDAMDDPPDRYDLLQVVEYWNEDWMAWTIYGSKDLVAVQKHGMGRITLREFMFNASPLDDFRWQTEPFLGPIVDHLKALGSLQSKLATAIELFLYPVILALSDTGQAISLSPDNVGSAIPVNPDFKPIEFRPSINESMLQQYREMLMDEIGKSTLTNQAFVQDMPKSNVSGFAVQQFLSSQTDQIVNYRASAEQVIADHEGDVLYLLEKYCPADGWEFATESQDSKRRKTERLYAEDIGGKYGLKIAIKVSSPQDLLQKVTIYNQLVAPDPVTQLPQFPPKVARELSRLNDDLLDQGAFLREQEWELLYRQDQEMQQLRLQAAKAEYAPEIAEMDKKVRIARRKKQRRDARIAASDIERGDSEDLVLPAEIKGDVQAISAYLNMIQQGSTPEDALAAVLSGSPMMGQMSGAPAMPGQSALETDAIIEAMFGAPQGGMPIEAQPNGMTGYGGIAPAALPPASQGAVPRQTQDSAEVAVEQMKQGIRRGALPAPR